MRGWTPRRRKRVDFELQVAELAYKASEGYIGRSLLLLEVLSLAAGKESERKVKNQCGGK